MKKVILLLAIGSLILFSSCDDDVNNFDLDKDPLSGKIGGVDWSYTGGRVDYSTISNQAAGKIFNQELTDPCLTVNTINAHLDIALFTALGTYNIGLLNSGEVRFILPNSSARYTAATGFIQIVEVTQFEIIGYLSARWDDDNFVEGSFLVNICN
ncbi:MAG: hypothetical protein CMP48_18250 [Rickettsiales bacterium]|nr:hypothetical protein [Rickettsiales bacterium]